MREPLVVSVDELRAVCTTLLDHLAAIEPTVRLERDYFWAISADERYDVYTPPSDLTIGQLSESWQNLVDMRPDETVTYGLVWLADVLRSVGEVVVR